MKFINTIIFFRKKYFILLVFLFCSILIFAQDCKNMENYCHHPREKNFSKSGMSQSSEIIPAQKKTFNVSMLAGKEYYIAVCGQSVVGKLKIRILSYDNKLMYDNAVDGLSDNYTIKSEITQTLIIEVIAPLGTLLENKMACLGVYVASRNFNRK